MCTARSEIGDPTPSARCDVFGKMVPKQGGTSLAILIAGGCAELLLGCLLCLPLFFICRRRKKEREIFEPFAPRPQALEEGQSLQTFTVQTAPAETLNTPASWAMLAAAGPVGRKSEEFMNVERMLAEADPEEIVGLEIMVGGAPGEVAEYVGGRFRVAMSSGGEVMLDKVEATHVVAWLESRGV